MKKQFTKIKIAAENLSRSNKSDYKDYELEIIEKQVDKYRDVLEKMVRKLPIAHNGGSGSGSTSNSSAMNGVIDSQEKDKRIKKQSHYKVGTALVESSKELTRDLTLHHVLFNCGEMEKSMAEYIVTNELETEVEVVRRLKQMLDNEIQEISTMKRNVSRTLQEYTSLKRSYEAAIRLDEPQMKISHLKDQQEQSEVKLEKERDTWAAQMFELITNEDVIIHCIRDYVLNQRNYHERALKRINTSLNGIQDIIQSRMKSRFGTPLAEHLSSTKREISYIIELCVCCLIENGLSEEGLLRVGCASTKLKRMKSALEARYVKSPLPVDYQDPHVIGSILKLYLRELPEPLLTYTYFKDFINAVEMHSGEVERKAEIKAIVDKLPKANYDNLRYLTKFLWLVTQFVEQNKMSSQNVAIVMSPNMLWPKVDKNNPADYMGQVNCSSAVNIIVDLLISQWNYFFEGEVDFFVTLQPNKLFIDDKNKANTSNEHLDRQDQDSDSSRFGTFRRNKPNAPTAPTPKIQHISCQHLSNGHNAQVVVGDGQQYHDCSNMCKAKELISHNSSGEIVHDGNDKPLLPKQSPAYLSLPNQYKGSNSGNENSNTTIHSSGSDTSTTVPPIPPPVKPIPMTRTQFLSLDAMNSSVVDRKSNENTNSTNLNKPDLPNKPKLPKRPMALSLSSSMSLSKTDEEALVVPLSAGSCPDTSSISGEGLISGNNRGHKTAEQFVQEHYNNVTALQAKIGTSNIGSIGEKDTDQIVATSSQDDECFSLSEISSTAGNNSSSTNGMSTTNKCGIPSSPSTMAAVVGPKRPTIPAPPPPIMAKKNSPQSTDD